MTLNPGSSLTVSGALRITPAERARRNAVLGAEFRADAHVLALRREHALERILSR